MKLTLDDFRAFLAVADVASFRAAAHALGITAPALTQRVQKLEQLLEARLFDRTTRAVALTQVGRLFLPEARRAVREFEDSLLRLRDVLERRSGTVAFACMLTVAHGLVPGMLARFRRQSPEVKVRIFDDTGLRVSEHLRDGQAEFGIGMSGDDDSAFVFEPIASEPYVLACSVGHLLAGRDSLTWAELERYQYLAFGFDGRVGRQLATVQQSLRWNYEVQHVGTMLAMIQNGLGIGAVPYFAVHNNPALVCLRLAEPELSRTVGIVRRAGVTLSPAAEAMAAIARETIREAYEAIQAP
jgi:DNA-binding transcriptional LysR family regulator